MPGDESLLQLAELERMGEDELRQECQQWRSLMSWLDPTVKWWLYNVGKPVRILGRNFKWQLGLLRTAKFELESVELGITEIFTDYEKGRKYYEEKQVVVPAGFITLSQVIDEQIDAGPALDNAGGQRDDGAVGEPLPF